MEENKFKQFDYFASSVYVLEKTEFLESVTEVSDEYLENSRKKDPTSHEIDLVRMTSHYFNDERIKDFSKYVAQTSWNILQHQGYAMQDYQTFFLEMWTQEHHKLSSMDQHMHSPDAKIVAFYFLNEPKDSSKIVFHDPRSAKLVTNLPEQDINNVTSSSIMVNFEPKAGTLLLTNNYLPHSISRHASNDALKFVHMTIGISQIQNEYCAEVI